MTTENRKPATPAGREGEANLTQRQGPDSQVQGEGNYTAAREYNDATRAFVASGKVDAAADAAAPQSQQQAQELRDAETEGRSHLKEEDPQIDGGRSRSDGTRG